MKSFSMRGFGIGLVILVWIGSVNADLLPRLGGVAVYDTDRDITWLADPLAGAGSTFDDGADPSDGLMTWASAQAWVESLTVGNVSDWRLPRTPIQDDNICQPVPSGFNCTNSELGHLFYEELSGIAGSPVTDSGDQDLALFDSPAVIAWSEIPYFSPEQAYTFNMLTGGQFTQSIALYRAVWAVRTGDVGIIATVDIKPGSDSNSINLCSNGAIPVAILGSDTFEVLDENNNPRIDTESLRFAEAAVKVVGKKDPHSLCSYEDVNGDSFIDLVCHYVTTDIAGIDGEATSATVNGELVDGTPIEGTDSVSIVKDTCN